MAPVAGLDMGYKVSRCDSCGFLFASELPPGERYAQYYKIASKYDQVASSAAIPEVDRIRVRFAVDLCRPHLASHIPVADLGCGVGHLLHAFDEGGWHDLCGLDPAPGSREKAKNLFNLREVHCGLLSDAPGLLPLYRIGLVCLTGVLEHLWSLREDMQSLLHHLSPDTLILLEVPAMERFALEPLEPFGEFSLEHIQYFSITSLVRLMRSFGAEVLETRLLSLPGGTTDSIFGLFRTGQNFAPVKGHPTADADIIDGYLKQSAEVWHHALDRIAAATSPWIIYGAGSHCARLLPALNNRKLDGNVIGIVDGNANLQGQQIGRWTIQTPAFLDQHPSITVVISSFRAQTEIHNALSGCYSNPLLCLYPKM